MSEEITTKRCAKCGEVKPVSEFYKSKESKDGLQSYCKECHRAANSKRKESLRIISATPAQPNPDNPLSAYEPRQLMEELRRRGFDGDLFFKKTEIIRIKLSEI